ncbi:50S ribosomal protein L19 [Candidatus Saccharibacteria bacterium]|nr:50S ribosomal protein L19 [Candidatus Saccharibacteria bacterium]
MSFSILKQIGDAQKKKKVVDVRSGDTVKVTQKIKEGDKFRLQMFEGVVIRADRKESHTARIVVRKVTSGVGVEKSFLIHSPLIEKIEVTKRSKVRRNNLSYLRDRSGKSARLSGKDFDRAAVNDVTVAEEAEAVKAPEAEAADAEAADIETAEAPVEEAKEVAEEKAEEVAEEKPAEA